MQPNTTQDIFDLLDGNVTAAALGAAMELGLFWLLAERPRTVEDVAGELGIPLNRCTYWLQLLKQLGLVQDDGAGYEVTALARTAILDVYSQQTWAFLAWGFRGESPAVNNLPENIRKPVSTWELQGLTPPDYLEQIRGNPDYAARFTQMIYEVHLELAEQIAGMLDLRGIGRMMDLGGGSGVISHALLRANPGLTSTIVDSENVCPVGLALAQNCGLGDRLSYVAADFTEADLPAGCDLALICDVGPQREDVLRRIHAALNDGGRLVLVDKYAPDEHTAAPSRLTWALLGALAQPADNLSLTTAEMMLARLKDAGFSHPAAREVPTASDVRWDVGWTLIEAWK